MMLDLVEKGREAASLENRKIAPLRDISVRNLGISVRNGRISVKVPETCNENRKIILFKRYIRKNDEYIRKKPRYIRKKPRYIRKTLSHRGRKERKMTVSHVKQQTKFGTICYK
jgi:hypothetical protein